MASKNIPVNGWPQLKDLEAVQPILNRLDKIEAWKRTVKEETFTGEEITIPNALALPARSLVTEINAIQDLHGLPFPYVGGAYKNKFPITVENLKTLNTTGTWSGNVYTVSGGTITIVTDDGGNVTGIKANGTFNADVYMLLASVSTLNSILSGSYILNGCPSGGGESTYYIRIGSSGTDGGTGANVSTPFTGTNSYIFIKSGYTANNVLFLPMIRLSTESDATFAPYSNKCPISGRTAVVVDDVGKNKLPITVDSVKTLNGGASSWSNNSKVINGVTFKLNTDSDGNLVSISTSGTASGNANLDLVRNFTVSASFLSGTPSGSTGNNYYIRCGINGAYYTDSGNGVAINGTITSIWIGVANGNPAPSNPWLPMIESGSAKTSYEPYAHSSATIQLGTTVYGADINWDTGVMTVKTAAETFDGSSDETWTQGGTSAEDVARYLATLGNNADYASSSDYNKIIANYQKTAWAQEIGNIKLYSATMLDMYLDKSMVNGITPLRAFLANNPLQICYKLATPTTIQLTPEQLTMLKGYNRITLSDGYGTIELKALTGANWS